MLYIASALTPTPVIHTLRVESFTSAGSVSLIAAKPDRVEVWDVDKVGLTPVTELRIWGNVISIAKAAYNGSAPHILVLTSPPNAQLLVLAYQPGPKPSLSVTSSISLVPPTPTLRQAEYFNAVISQGNVALVNLWTGVLSCVELDFEKDKEAKRRRSSVAADESEGEGKRLKIQDHFNINVREHNLLQMAFMPATHNQLEPVVSVIWQSSSKALHLQTRAVSLAARSFEDKTTAVNVVTPLSEVHIPNEDEFDFNDIPYSCPAARHVLPVTPDSVLVIGDEHSVLYKLHKTPSSPRISRASVSSASGTATSPRANAIRRSPQNEMSAPGKRRKSSNTARRSLDACDRWELKPIWRARQGFGTILAASLIESHETGATVAISDESGRLTVYGWEINPQVVAATGQKGTVHLSKIEAGSSSPATSITYLDASHLFLASSCGDSMLVELQAPGSVPITSPPRKDGRDIPSRKGKDRLKDNEEGLEWAIELSEATTSYTTRERWMNLAPLRDFCVVKDEGGAMSHLVTASGAANSNSLRTIRSGVGLEDRLSIQGFSEVTAMFPIAGRLLVSTRTSTTMLQIHQGAHVLPLTATISALPTLAVGSIGDSLFLHAGPRAVTLRAVDAELTIKSSWQVADGQEIVAVSISGDLVVAAKRGGEVSILQRSSEKVQELCTARVSSEVYTVAVASHTSLPSPVIAVSTWSGELLLYSLDHLLTVDPLVTSMHEPFAVTSLVLRPGSSPNTSSGMQLLAGLSDGTMVIYEVELGSEGGGVKATNRKASGLGTRPLQLVSTGEMSHNEETIIGVGLSERMSVVFESKGRIDFSTVNRKYVTAATGMTIGGEDCLVLASPSGITFTSVASLKKLSVQTLDLQDRSPVKIVNLPNHKVIGLGSISRKMDPETGDLVQKGYFELREQTTLELLVEMPLESREQVTSLNSVFLLGRQYLTVGTALFSDEEMDEYSHGAGMIYAKEGKMYLVEVRQTGKDWEIAVKTSYDTAGAVHDTAVIHGFLAVASASKVTILRLDASPFAFKEVSQFSSAFIAQHLYVAEATKTHRDPRLIIGDGMRSIFALEVDDESGTIYADQRDLATYQVMGLEGIQDNGQSIILADGNSDLLTLRLNENIETAASFGLHEPISQFRQGSLVPQSSAPDVMRPELLFGTVDGRLGVIGELTGGATATLNDLQRNMDKYHLGPGGVDWRTWRRGGTEMIKRETAGFIDGDFVQQFLDLDMVSAEGQTKLMDGTNQHERVSRMSADGKTGAAEKGDVIGVLEALAGLH